MEAEMRFLSLDSLLRVRLWRWVGGARRCDGSTRAGARVKVVELFHPPFPGGRESLGGDLLRDLSTLDMCGRRECAVHPISLGAECGATSGRTAAATPCMIFLKSLILSRSTHLLDSVRSSFFGGSTFVCVRGIRFQKFDILPLERNWRGTAL